MLIGMQQFKRSGRALVFELINDLKIPYNAQQVRDGMRNAGIHGFRQNGEFFGVRKQIQQVHVLAHR
jgi:hypothetical protein